MADAKALKVSCRVSSVTGRGAPELPDVAMTARASDGGQNRSSSSAPSGSGSRTYVLRSDFVRLVEPSRALDVKYYAREDQQPHQAT